MGFLGQVVDINVRDAPHSLRVVGKKLREPPVFVHVADNLRRVAPHSRRVADKNLRKAPVLVRVVDSLRRDAPHSRRVADKKLRKAPVLVRLADVDGAVARPRGDARRPGSCDSVFSLAICIVFFMVGSARRGPF